jgi:hypothetical protein
MSFQEEYNEMDGLEEDDIPILDVRRYWAVEDFEDDMKLYDTKPEWVIIDNVIYKKKTEEEVEKAKIKKPTTHSSVRRKA